MQDAHRLPRPYGTQVKLWHFDAKLQSTVAQETEHLVAHRSHRTDLDGAADYNAIGWRNDLRLSKSSGSFVAAGSGGYAASFSLTRCGLSLLHRLARSNRPMRELHGTVEVQARSLEPRFGLGQRSIGLICLRGQDGVVQTDEDLAAPDLITLYGENFPDAHPSGFSANDELLPCCHRAVADDQPLHGPDLGAGRCYSKGRLRSRVFDGRSRRGLQWAMGRDELALVKDEGSCPQS
jgi:hypothetical protein